MIKTESIPEKEALVCYGVVFLENISYDYASKLVINDNLKSVKRFNMTVKEAAEMSIAKLEKIYDLKESTTIVEMLFLDSFDISNININREFDFQNQLNIALEKLENSEPIQYVTGQAHFFGFTFKVNKHVLIPRPETEELVYWILEDLKGNRKQLDVLDIGVGSGCISLTLKKKKETLRVFGVDYNMDILNVARINSRRLKAPMTFLNYDFLEEVYWEEMGFFDIIVSNPPYIRSEDRSVMADNVLLHEPEAALFAGKDHLIFYKKMERFAGKHLSPNGTVYLEIHEDSAHEVSNLFETNNRKVTIKKDLQGKNRMIKIQFLNPTE